MSQNVISATLADDTFTAILDGITKLSSQLDFMIDLSPEDRRNLPKLGDSSQSFVQRALEMAQNHSDILPRRFDIDEFNRDVVLFNRLNSIKNRLSPLLDKLRDTTLAAGSDAWSQSLEVYGFAKAAGTGEGLEELRRDMSRRFNRRSVTTVKEETE